MAINGNLLVVSVNFIVVVRLDGGISVMFCAATGVSDVLFSSTSGEVSVVVLTEGFNVSVVLDTTILFSVSLFSLLASTATVTFSVSFVVVGTLTETVELDCSLTTVKRGVLDLTTSGSNVTFWCDSPLEEFETKFGDSLATLVLGIVVVVVVVVIIGFKMNSSSIVGITGGSILLILWLEAKDAI